MNIAELQRRAKGWVLIPMIAMLLLSLLNGIAPCAPATPHVGEDRVTKVAAELIGRHGEAHRIRIEHGVRQVASFWLERDGAPSDFEQFCLAGFIADEKTLAETFARYENNFESIFGHFSEMYRDLSWPIHVDVGPVLAIDQLFSEFSPSAHMQEDLFQSRIAFHALLNFPVFTLEEKLKLGGAWSRERWAMARLADRFISRVPAEIAQRMTQAFARAENYINSYNICMHNLVTPDGKRLFPEGLKLISHWGLRDELKSQYRIADGLPRQRMIAQVMARIIRQEIPARVVNCPDVDWEPSSNAVYEKGKKVEAPTEDDERYRHLLELFRAGKLEDPYSPLFPTVIDRRFKRDRELLAEEAEKLLVSVLSSKEVARCAQLIQKRLGRPLEEFDIWYKGFEAGKNVQESRLDEIVRKRYPDAAAFQKDIPKILGKLGFSKERAVFISERIVVDPARGAGHAMSAGRRVDKAHLRTRVEKGGMNYKGFNIAMHELGHNVEQIISLHLIDHTLLQGVPNFTFTEAFAFIFQARDLEVLGVKKASGQDDSMKDLEALWSTYEIAGVTIVEMRVWRWLYEHPDADEHQLKAAVLAIAKDVWNRYYAPVLGVKDSILLGVYSHMIDTDLYLVNYPLGHIIAFQIEEYFKTAPLASEMERMCRQGSITPEAWMRGAVNDSVSAAPLLTAASRALDTLER